jgi:hypothetical protein
MTIPVMSPASDDSGDMLNPSRSRQTFGSHTVRFKSGLTSPFQWLSPSPQFDLSIRQSRSDAF